MTTYCFQSSQPLGFAVQLRLTPELKQALLNAQTSGEAVSLRFREEPLREAVLAVAGQEYCFSTAPQAGQVEVVEIAPRSKGATSVAGIKQRLTLQRAVDSDARPRGVAGSLAGGLPEERRKRAAVLLDGSQRGAGIQPRVTTTTEYTRQQQQQPTPAAAAAAAAGPSGRPTSNGMAPPPAGVASRAAPTPAARQPAGGDPQQQQQQQPPSLAAPAPRKQPDPPRPRPPPPPPAQPAGARPQHTTSPPQPDAPAAPLANGHQGHGQDGRAAGGSGGGGGSPVGGGAAAAPASGAPPGHFELARAAVFAARRGDLPLVVAALLRDAPLTASSLQSRIEAAYRAAGTKAEAREYVRRVLDNCCNMSNNRMQLKPDVLAREGPRLDELDSSASPTADAAVGGDRGRATAAAVRQGQNGGGGGGGGGGSGGAAKRVASCSPDSRPSPSQDTGAGSGFGGGRGAAMSEEAGAAADEDGEEGAGGGGGGGQGSQRGGGGRPPPLQAKRQKTRPASGAGGSGGGGGAGALGAGAAAPQQQQQRRPGQGQGSAAGAGVKRAAKQVAAVVPSGYDDFDDLADPVPLPSAPARPPAARNVGGSVGGRPLGQAAAGRPAPPRASAAGAAAAAAVAKAKATVVRKVQVASGGPKGLPSHVHAVQPPPKPRLKPPPPPVPSSADGGDGGNDGSNAACPSDGVSDTQLEMCMQEARGTASGARAAAATAAAAAAAPCPSIGQRNRGAAAASPSNGQAGATISGAPAPAPTAAAASPSTESPPLDPETLPYAEVDLQEEDPRDAAWYGSYVDWAPQPHAAVQSYEQYEQYEKEYRAKYDVYHRLNQKYNEVVREADAGRAAVESARSPEERRRCVASLWRLGAVKWKLLEVWKRARRNLHADLGDLRCRVAEFVARPAAAAASQQQ